MKYILASLTFLVSLNVYASGCSEVLKFEKENSTIYVVCPKIDSVNRNEALGIIKAIFSSRVFEPDEYEIYFVVSKDVLNKKVIPSTALIGLYYTHSSQLKIWPGIKKKTKVIELGAK